MHYSFYVVKHVPFQKTQRHEKTFAVEHRAFKHLNFPVVAHSVTFVGLQLLQKILADLNQTGEL